MLLANKTEVEPDRRKYQRFDVALYGRLMLSDRSEFRCKVFNMSPGNVSLTTDGAGRLGERVIAYLDHVGRLDGRIARIKPDGFALEFEAPPGKQTKLARQLAWLSNRTALSRPEDRRHERIAPRNTAGILCLEDGSQYRCNVVDLSLSGAAVEVDVTPPVGTEVSLRGMRGRVARHIEGGISIEFTTLQRRENLEPFLG
ncbi:MAG: PilZ domain-containing protein [Oricola sp.]